MTEECIQCCSGDHVWRTPRDKPSSLPSRAPFPHPRAARKWRVWRLSIGWLVTVCVGALLWKVGTIWEIVQTLPLPSSSMSGYSTQYCVASILYTNFHFILFFLSYVKAEKWLKSCGYTMEAEALNMPEDLYSHFCSITLESEACLFGVFHCFNKTRSKEKAALGYWTNTVAQTQCLPLWPGWAIWVLVLFPSGGRKSLDWYL